AGARGPEVPAGTARNRAPRWSASRRRRGTRPALNARRGTRTCWRPPGRAWGGGRWSRSCRAPVGEQPAGVGALPHGRFGLRSADMDEAGDALVRAEPEQAQHVFVVGRPAGQALRAEAAALGRLQQGEADASGRSEAFGLGDLRVLAEAGDDRDHQRRAEAPAVLVERRLRGLRVAFEHAPYQRFAECVAGISCDADEAPRHAAAVVGDADRGLEHALQGGLVGPGFAKQARRGRASRVQRCEEGVHGGTPNAMHVTYPRDMNGLAHSPHYARLYRGRLSFCRGMEPRWGTAMSVQHPEMAAHGTADPARLLEELKRICVEQLGADPSGLYRSIEEQLHDSLRVGGDAAHRKDLMTVLALRQRGSGYVMRYRELIGRSFDDFCGRASPGKPAAPLGLVRENELDFHLAGQRLAESISRRYQRPLEMLGLRFDSLAACLGKPRGGNPVGANLLADAFVQTFGDAEISPTLQPLLFRQYEQELAKVLGELYGRLNTQLAANGFHADPRREQPAAAPVPTVPRQPAAAPATDPLERILSPVEPRQPAQPLLSPTGAFPATPEPAPASSGTGGPANPDVFRVAASARVQHQQLRDMLRLWREGMLGEQTVPSGLAPERRLDGRRPLRVEELVSVASLLQGDGTRNFEAALAGKCGLHEAIREELREGARRLGLDPDQTCLDPQQEDAVDMTGLLFESLINSHALLQEARRMFTRLAMSYVKDALTDENLFVRPDHPARKLLDTLAQGCEGNDGASPQERELLQRSRAVVERIVSEFNEDLAIFEVAANELQDLLQQQQRRAEVVERRAAETVHGRERLVDARTRAAAALAGHLEGRVLTPTVAHFLERHWQHHLVQVLLRDGEGSERHQRVLDLASELVAVDELAAR